MSTPRPDPTPTTPTTPVPARPVLGVPALLVALVVVAGCTPTSPTAPDPTPTPTTSTTTTSISTTSPAPVPGRGAPTTPAVGQGVGVGVDRADPDAVATTVLGVMFTADTTTDRGPNDAAARAVALLTPAYAAAVVGTPPVRGAGAVWASWAARGVHLSPVLAAVADDHPPDTPTAAYRTYLLTQTPTTSTGQVLAPVVFVAYVQLRRSAGGWAVDTVEQR